MAYRDVRKAHCDNRSECIGDGGEFGDLWSSSKQVVHDLKEILTIDVSGDDAQCIDIGAYEVIRWVKMLRLINESTLLSETD